MTGSRCFYLGGYDLEMVTIRDLLLAHGERVADRRLSWGARASAYADEIREAVARGVTPVVVELLADLPLPDGTIRIDHHGEMAGKDRPTSLEQVFALLGLPHTAWTRWHALVAANDRGHVRAMLALAPSAMPEELNAIRAADRAAQGITTQEEEVGAVAAANAETTAAGRLTVVHLPHDRTAAVADRLDATLGGPGYETLVILSPTQVSVFGPGRVIRALAERWPDGWYGGDLPDVGFWGRAPIPDELLDQIRVLVEG